MPLLPGQILNQRYRVVKLLGQGGFANVYQVWDLVLERPCALKENLEASAEAVRQFEREAKILANLSHPGLPRVTDHFVIPGQGQYLVMDYVEGQDLQEILESSHKPLPEEQAVEWIRQVCDALAYLHSQNPPIIHRDIKPANIKVTPKGQAVLVDFGIAKVYDPRLRTTAAARAVTPGFSPIEQYGHGATDARTDVYALAATLYTLLTGQEPPESVQRVGRDPLIPAGQLNPSLSSVTLIALERALQVAPENRYQSAQDFKQALTPQPSSSGIQGRGKPVSRLTWAWMSVISAVVILVVLFLLIFGGEKGIAISLIRKTPAVISPGWTASPSAFLPSDALIATETPEVIPSVLPSPLVTLNPIALPEVYEVRRGDTCSGIAFKFGVSMQSILLLNRMPDCNRLYDGQKLLLPAGSSLRAEITPSVQETPLSSPASPTPMQPFISDVDGMEMVYIPPGVFVRGADEFALEAGRFEKPATFLYLDAFWIDRTEVTNGMYALCVQAGVCHPPQEVHSRTRPGYYGEPAYRDYPVIYVSWEDAQAYCAWSGRRLPTEAEWEKAARGSDGRKYPWGEAQADASLANFNSQVGDTTPVGNYLAGASPFGALDMAGNVAEWVADWFASDYYGLSPVINPLGPAKGEFRLLRGGSWFSSARAIRTFSRLWNYPYLHFDSSGFRCALSP